MIIELTTDQRHESPLATSLLVQSLPPMPTAHPTPAVPRGGMTSREHHENRTAYCERPIINHATHDTTCDQRVAAALEKRSRHCPALSKIAYPHKVAERPLSRICKLIKPEV